MPQPLDLGQGRLHGRPPCGCPGMQVHPWRPSGCSQPDCPDCRGLTTGHARSGPPRRPGTGTRTCTGSRTSTGFGLFLWQVCACSSLYPLDTCRGVSGTEDCPREKVDVSTSCCSIEPSSTECACSNLSSLMGSKHSFPLTQCRSECTVCR